MRNTFLVEALLLGVLAVLFGSALNPYWMPMGMQLTVLTAAILLFGSYAIFLWRERGGDERETMLRTKSDRIAFLAGATTLFCIVLYHGVVTMQEAPWAIGALGAMVLAKVGAYLYFERRH